MFGNESCSGYSSCTSVISCCSTVRLRDLPATASYTFAFLDLSFSSLNESSGEDSGSRKAFCEKALDVMLNVCGREKGREVPTIF